MRTALEQGYRVRAVVRKSGQIKELQAHPNIAPLSGNNLEFVVIPDLAKTGAFDNVLHDITAILHLASPLAIEVKSASEMPFLPGSNTWVVD